MELRRTSNRKARMNYVRTLGALGIVCLSLGSQPVVAVDWPQWGGRPQRNMAASESNLPALFVPGDKRPDGTGIDLATTKNVRWTVKLGSETYASPTVAKGRVYICTNDQSLKDPRYPPTGGGLLMCVDEATGRLYWQLPVRRLSGKTPWRKYANLKYDLGICSSPTVEDDRVYIVTNRGEVLCLDVAGLANGNDGIYRDEARYTNGAEQPPVKLGPTDPDILWRFDTLAELKIFPHDANCSSPLIFGDVVYVNTANGVDNNGTPFPDAPSLIGLDKRTGRLVAYDDAKIGRRLFHGQWSSPSLGKINGKNLIFFGGGDGMCYAFEALEKIAERAMPLTCVWSCDCNPPEYRFANGKAIDYWDGTVHFENSPNKNDGTYVGPSEIIATPVLYKDRIYVGIGQDPEHGRGRGMFACIDATKTGDITKTGKVWTYGEMQRSICTPAVADGLVYVADVVGTLHCLDADTGRCQWTYPTKQEVWTGLSVADRKVFLGTKKSFWIFAAGREPKVLGQVKLGTAAWSPAVAANNTLYVGSQKYLWAVHMGGPAPGKPEWVQSATPKVQGANLP